MLEKSITQCPEGLWVDSAFQNPFWHIAYHTIFYVHLYLQPAEEDFQPWEKHREEYQFMGRLPWPPHDPPKIEGSYSKAEVLEYLAWLKTQIAPTVETLDLSGPSGFSWLPFNKLELQFYTIRHLQQHAGELSERLYVQAGLDVEWVGKGGN